MNAHQINNKCTLDNNKKESRSLDKDNSKKKEDTNRVQFKGITLKEYFRLCERTIAHKPMQAIAEQENNEAIQLEVGTPAFGVNLIREKHRQIFKTEVNEENHESIVRINHKKTSGLGNSDLKSFNRKNISMQDQSNQNITKKTKKSNNQKSKRLVTIPSKYMNDSFVRSTMGTFYYFNDKKQKMLDKVKAQRQRIKSMKLNQIFLVTKYATKFNLSREVIK